MGVCVERACVGVCVGEGTYTFLPFYRLLAIFTAC